MQTSLDLTTVEEEARPLVDFDEKTYINEALQTLQELHGSYTLQDVGLVRQMAAYQRSYLIADSQLYNPWQHVRINSIHGALPNSWLKIRESASQMILRIRKDLAMDIATRTPMRQGQMANDSLFNLNLNEEKVLVRRR